jgi:hypothetical protein
MQQKGHTAADLGEASAYIQLLKDAKNTFLFQ